MVYNIRVERICRSGVPFGVPQVYEASSELEAVAIATYEVDAHRSGPQRIATVFDASGVLVLAYAGRTRGEADARRG